MRMKVSRKVKSVRTTALSLVLLSALGCSLHKANKAYTEGRYDDAVMAYRDILEKAPTNTSAKLGLQRAAKRASDAHMAKATEASKRGMPELEKKEVENAVLLDPTNTIATERLTAIEEELREQKEAAQREQSIEAIREAAESDFPELINPRSMEGVDLNFQRKTQLREIFANLSRASGVNIILHQSFNEKDKPVSVDLRGLQFQKILDTLMLQNELFYRVIDAKTIVVISDTSSNREKYENQAIKVFYLSHATPDEVRNALSQFNTGGSGSLKAYPDKRQNAVAVRGRPRDVATATRIIQQMDKPKAEVMIYMELLEITQEAAEKVGIRPTSSGTDSDYSLKATTKSHSNFLNTSVGSLHVKSSDLRYIFPSLAIDALKKDSEARVLASPNIRVTSDMEGSVNIGQEVSSLQSASLNTVPNPTNQGGTNPTQNFTMPTQNFGYTKVGVDIKVKPRVHFNGDVSLEITSNVSEVLPGNPQRPNTSKREIKSHLRLRDGEVALFAGLIKEGQTNQDEGFWGISDIPFLGKLLGSKTRGKTKTDVILTVRAVIVRKAELKPSDLEPYDPDFQKGKEGPFYPKENKVKPRHTPKPAANGAPAMPPSQRPAPPPPPAPPPSAEPPVAEPSAPQTPKPEPPKPEAPKPEPPIAPQRTETPAQSLKPTDAVPQGNVKLFLAPTFETLKKGEKIQLCLNISNAGGLSSGSIELRIDPKLKLLSIKPGDFLVGEGGSLNQGSEKNGLIPLSFRRTNAASDSGAVAIIELQSLTAGNAPVIIQKGQYMAGTKPVPGQVVNALLTVQ